MFHYVQSYIYEVIEMKKIQNVILFNIFFPVFTVASQDVVQDKRSYVAHAIMGTEVPEIDGCFDEALWGDIAWEGDFVEAGPDENTAPGQPTQFKLVYDDNFLYVAIQCLDAVPEKIVKRLSRRDDIQGDWVAIGFDSYSDKRTAFVFRVSAAGVKGDAFVTENGNNDDDSWNPIWYVATTINSQGWNAEMKIPFSQLKFGKSVEQLWGLQVARNLFREQEMSVWDRIPQNSAGWISESGTLHGLKNIKAQHQLEIQPFVVTQYDTYASESGNPFRDGKDLGFNGGIDAKIGLTNDLTLDLTVNPDFGQVEADPGAIALDGFQIFFNERRPFFVENKNIFDFQFANGSDNLFYSRRIGRSPQGSVSRTADAYVDQPNNTVILGAARLSGKTKNGWSLGLLETVTDNMFAKIIDNGEESKQRVEPMTNYLVGRAQKDFNSRMSYVGAIITATHRDLGANFQYLREAAYSGGVDFMHNWQDRKYYLTGNFVASNVQGSKEAISATQSDITHLFIRSDASHIALDTSRTMLAGTGGKLEIGKATGIWLYDGGFIWRSPELELNDIGFLRQADEIRQYLNLTGQFQTPTDWYRGTSINLGQYTTYDFEGNLNRLQFNLKGDVNFKNNWEVGVNMIHKPLININTYLRGGPRWRFSEENGIFLSAGSDRRKKFNVNVRIGKSQAEENNFSFTRYSISMGYQPANALRLSLETSYRNAPSKTQYVTQGNFINKNFYILAAIDQVTWSTSLRVNYNINPNLTLQYYGQPFISRGVYDDFNYVKKASAEKLAERIQLYSEQQIKISDGIFSIDHDEDGRTDFTFENPDFSYVQFRSNLVVRWEYVPGSELYFVWSQGITGLDDPMSELGQSLRYQIFDQQLNNTFLIKATYRFVL